jgi:hypothetical protein
MENPLLPILRVYVPAKPYLCADISSGDHREKTGIQVAYRRQQHLSVYIYGA